jgi:hypothetical protein
MATCDTVLRIVILCIFLLVGMNSMRFLNCPSSALIRTHVFTYVDNVYDIIPGPILFRPYFPVPNI